MNLFQSDFMCIGSTENHFWAASSSVVCINAVRLCIQFKWSGVLIGSGPIFKTKFAVTAVR